MLPILRKVRSYISSIQIRKKKRNELLELGVPINGSIPKFLIGSTKNLRKLKSLPGTEISILDERLYINLSGITLSATTEEELFILNEIFYGGIYNFQLNDRCLVLDIGMNVGFSSLFFAAKDNVVKVIGYEPLKPTFRRALENLQLNPGISMKIDPINLGIGIKNEKRTINFYEEFKGSVSVTNDNHFVPKKKTKITKEEITLINALDLLTSIRKEYLNIHIVCKIDCEGSEYEIFRSLSNLDPNLLPETFMVEWHYKGNEEIVQFLTKRNYLVFAFSPISDGIGMLYATRR